MQLKRFVCLWEFQKLFSTRAASCAKAVQVESFNQTVTLTKQKFIVGKLEEFYLMCTKAFNDIHSKYLYFFPSIYCKHFAFSYDCANELLFKQWLGVWLHVTSNYIEYPLAESCSLSQCTSPSPYTCGVLILHRLHSQNSKFRLWNRNWRSPYFQSDPANIFLTVLNKKNKIWMFNRGYWSF